ncbi:hypothetical protein L7F22_011777 [Adiantum nelumboides]|nr:hypothetical protein [Adiantum nelumboides]
MVPLAGKPYDLPASSNASRLTIRLDDGCSKGPCCVFSALDYVKLQRRSSEHTSTSRINIRFALELADKPYDLPASSNANLLNIWLADECSKGLRCVFKALDCVKLQRGHSKHPSASRIIIQIALELVGKPYDLPASSNASRLTIRIIDGCSEAPIVSRITIRLALELAGNPYDLSTSSNANRITIRIAEGCSEGPRCVFSALNCITLQRGPFEHPSASRITIQLALELAGKPYDLPASSNANRLTIWLADGCSKCPHCVFKALDYVKLQRGPSKHTSVSRIIIQIALELVGKPYDLPASSNASRLIIRIIDGCSEGSSCVSGALYYIKLQRGPSEHPSASHITIRLALELVGKSYGLPVSSNASRLTIRLADRCSKTPRCVFSALNCVKLQRGSFEHPSASRINIQLALELGSKLYDLPTSSNASRLIIRLADGYSERPCCVFSALDCVKLQRGSSEHPSASRISIRIALELAGKPYDLPASSNARRLTIRLVDGCLECPHCVFKALEYVKLQRKFFEHASASRITIRFALELFGKPYDLTASSNANPLTIRLADGCSKDPRSVFRALDYVKLQRGSFEHTSASRITIRLALELAGKAYDLLASSNARPSEHPSASCIITPLALELADKANDLSASFNASRLIIRLDDGCSKGPRCVFCALDCVKLQHGSSEHPSTKRITIRFALEFANKPYDLLTSCNPSRFTIRFADGCSKRVRYVFSALNCVKLQRGTFAHTSAITIRLALELAANFNAKHITKRLADECSEGPRCVFSALDGVKLQRGLHEHLSANRITIRLVLKIAGKPYDLPASSNANRLMIRIADECSEGLRCVFRALNCVKLQHGPFEHTSASRITIRLALELAGKPYDLPASSNASRFTIGFADGCSKGDPLCVFSALNCVKLQRRSFEYPSASRITIQLALELADKRYDLLSSSNASRLTIRLADGCLEHPRCVFSDLDCVKVQRGLFEHTSASCITIRLALERFRLSI